MNREFFAILDHINKREKAVLSRCVDGVCYQREFIPKDRLILLGGGHISESLIKIAVMLDFSVTVVDDRYEFANTTRFPEAEKVLCGEFEEMIAALEITPRDYICVLTRGHSFDRECVSKILGGTMPFYLGMIGSKRKVSGVLESLRESGFADDRISAIHAPIGLPIGSVTVPEIAVSICAEMIGCRRMNQSTMTENTLLQTEVNMDLIRYLALENSPRALVMILSATGSTPAKAGAMMAVAPDGRIKGTIGGGCGEAQAKRAAMRMIGTGESKVITIRMENDAAADNGLVCGGSIRVLIEDIKEDNDETD